MWVDMKSTKIVALEPKSTDGLGHSKFSSYTGDAVIHKDPFSLLDSLEEELYQKHLDRILIVHIVKDFFDGAEESEKLLYFLEDGQVFKVGDTDHIQKNWKELEYVMFLLKGNDVVTEKWKTTIRTIISQSRKR